MELQRLSKSRAMVSPKLESDPAASLAPAPLKVSSAVCAGDAAAADSWTSAFSPHAGLLAAELQFVGEQTGGPQLAGDDASDSPTATVCAQPVSSADISSERQISE